ncbi:type II secretion system minor pseudopilin GspI [Luteimonas sp. e5]
MSERGWLQGGFSLLELLVALAVFALAVLALLNLGSQGIRAAALAEQRLLADIVAENRAVEAAWLPLAQLQASDAGVEHQDGREWRWRRQLQAMDGGLVRIRISVAASDAPQQLAERELWRPAR